MQKDNRTRWKKYSFFLKLNSDYIKGGKNTEGFFEPFTKNIFMRGFLADLYLRPSCYQCIAKSGKSNSDITIGDFWGIQAISPDFDDDKGVNIVLIYSYKGDNFYNATTHISYKTNNQNTSQYSINNSPKENFYRNSFFNDIDKKTVSSLLKTYTPSPYIRKIKTLIYRIKSKL